MERCVGKSRTISGDEQVSSLIVRRLQGHELYLARPLSELALRLGFGGCLRLFGSVKRLGARSGATPAKITGTALPRMHGVSFRRLSCDHGSLIIGKRLAFDERDGARRTRGQAIAHAIAKIVAQELRLAIDDADRTFVARVRAQAATCAFVFVNMNNCSNHKLPLKQFTLPPSAPRPGRAEGGFDYALDAPAYSTVPYFCPQACPPTAEFN